MTNTNGKVKAVSKVNYRPVTIKTTEKGYLVPLVEETRRKQRAIAELQMMIADEQAGIDTIGNLFQTYNKDICSKYNLPEAPEGKIWTIDGDKWVMRIIDAPEV